MSFVAIATGKFEESRAFYGEWLRLPVVRSWDRPNGRGVVFDARGMQVELLDASREPDGMPRTPPDGRVHLVIEVEDLEAERQALGPAAPEAVQTSWGARTVLLRDPDGMAVWLLEWNEASG